MKTILIALALTTGLAAAQPFQVQVSGHGRPMILIPGLSCPGEVWDGAVAHYKDHYQLHVISLAGFAGLPRVPGPFLETAREAIAAYIRESKLDHPIIAGHSLGGFLALDIAVHYPDLPGRLIIVDSYPMMAGIVDPNMTAEKAKAASEQMRKGMEQQSQDMFERTTKSGIFARPMVTKDSDLDRVIAWSLKSDRTAVTDSMSELFAADLRAELAKVKVPVLVMGAWIGYKEYGATHDTTETNLRAQYAKLYGVQIVVTDAARHFIMWDDPNWMFAQMDRFLDPPQNGFRPMKTRIAYWTCQAAGWGTYTVMGISRAAQQVGWRFSMIAGYSLFFLYSIVLTDQFRREIRRRQWLNTLTFFTFVRLFGAAFALAAIQTFLVFAIDLAFLQRASYFLVNPSYILATWISISGANCIWLLFYVALTAGRRYREKEVRLQLALREAELRALEAQINPHFLFNCLNSIRALVVENPGLAQDMITRFATILRYNLHRDLNHTVPLEAEVEIVSDYLALEAVRWEDRLRVRFAVDREAGKILIPPMLLQTLVENAVKHGIAPLPNGGDLVIRAAIDADSLRLEVENTGSLSEPKPGSTRVGLENTRERLRILYGDRAHLDLRNGDGRVTATVFIPRAL